MNNHNKLRDDASLFAAGLLDDDGRKRFEGQLRKLKESGSLYAAGLLEGAECRQFEACMRVLPELRTHVAEIQDAVAAVTLTAPPVEADPSNLEEIQRRVSGGPFSSITSLPGVLARLPGGWPIAALLTLLVGWGYVQHQSDRDQIAHLKGARDAVVRELELIIEALPMGGDPENGLVDGSLGGSSTAGGGNSSMHGHLAVGNQKVYRMLQDLETVKEQLAQFRKLEDERTKPSPGLARLTLVELADPSLTPEEREGMPVISDTVTDLIEDNLGVAGGDGQGEDSDPESESGGGTTGEQGSTEPEEPQVSPLTISARYWPREVTVSEGMLPFSYVRDLPNGTTIRQVGFTATDAEDLGFIPIEGDSFYDERGNMIWTPSSNGTDYLARRPGPEFDPEKPSISATGRSRAGARRSRSCARD